MAARAASPRRFPPAGSSQQPRQPPAVQVAARSLAWESEIAVADGFCTILPSISRKEEESVRICFHKAECRTIQNMISMISQTASPEGHRVRWGKPRSPLRSPCGAEDACGRVAGCRTRKAAATAALPMGNPARQRERPVLTIGFWSLGKKNTCTSCEQGEEGTESRGEGRIQRRCRSLGPHSVPARLFLLT